MSYCKYCKKELSKNQFEFCNSMCKDNFSVLELKNSEVLLYLNKLKNHENIQIRTLASMNQLQSKFFKDKVFELKGKMCEKCNTWEKKLEIHHKSYKLYIPENLKKTSFKSYHNKKHKEDFYIDYDHLWQKIFFEYPEYFRKNILNLMILCRSCHKKEHLELKKNTGNFMPVENYIEISPSKKDINIQPSKSKKMTLEELKLLVRKNSLGVENLNYENAGKPWTEDEEKCLKKMFEKSYTIKNISLELKRTQGSIRSRLQKIGLIEYDSQTKSYKKL